MKISAWKPQDKGYICLPLEKNVPVPKDDWKLVACPICGKDCWESDLAREVLSHDNMTGVCTECALRAGTSSW